MAHPAIQRLYETIARTPYYTGRSCAAEFGPPPGAVLDKALKQYSKVDLLRGNPKEMVEKIVRKSGLSSSMKRDLRVALTMEFNQRIKSANDDILAAALRKYSTLELLQGDRRALAEKIVSRSGLSSSLKGDLRRTLIRAFDNRAKRASTSDRRKAGLLR